MKRNLSPCVALPLIGLLVGCSGSGNAPGESPLLLQNFGPLTTRVVGTVQPPVTSSAAYPYGSNVTGIAGALIDQLTLNYQGPFTLADTKIAFVTTRNTTNDIYAMNQDGTAQTRLTTVGDNFYPSWSPDGTRIAFTSNRDGNSEVYVMYSYGGGQTRLTNNAAVDERPAWSPSSSKIAFSSTRDGNDEIYVMNANGTLQTRLTNNAAFDVEPVWSPNGTKIAFTSTRDGNAEIYIMNADGTNQTRLTNNAALDQQATWSPDGNKIVFTSNRDGNYEIYIMNADGTSQTNLTNTPSFDSESSWSPDGNKLTFTSSRDGNPEIYAMNANGTNQTRLTNNIASDYSSSWSKILPRAAKPLVGVGGSLGTTAAGFLFGQRGDDITSVVAFDTSDISRPDARVVNQTATETQGSNLIFSITTSAGLVSVKYVPIGALGVPGAPVAPTIPPTSNAALVSFNATTGLVSSVLPYAANRSTATPQRSGTRATYTGHFTAVFDGNGKNLAPNGAKSVTLDGKTGALVAFES